ncbi:MAG: uracil-DNA glycosylase [Steroidobacteraceae bacterium]
MSTARRQAYLQSLGIQGWRLRGGGSTLEPDALGGREGIGPADTPAPLPGDFRAPATSRKGICVPLEVPPELAVLGWEELRQRVAACTACGLAATRTQTVFGVGAASARWMIIGEAPGAEEDRRGEPFVGRAGQLLNTMLRALGLAREQVFIANILKCRPPNNRDPRPEEARSCAGFLHRQIELVQPKILLAVGRIAAQNLLGTDQSLGKLRQVVHRFGPAGLPLIITYHPAYLLRSPGEKRKAWEDLKLAQKVLEGGSGSS